MITRRFFLAALALVASAKQAFPKTTLGRRATVKEAEAAGLLSPAGKLLWTHRLWADGGLVREYQDAGLYMGRDLVVPTLPARDSNYAGLGRTIFRMRRVTHSTRTIDYDYLGGPKWWRA